ncbi:hypothetical protein ALC53_13792 [Atta colombica]|uniref:Uncharacterized protein n=1 Tax=Atta colombica TaxID=520822 RepID=A0A195AUS6_9HYME|nr:hypothetical protein ALC53_13792 [Atta colombica]
MPFTLAVFHRTVKRKIKDNYDCCAAHQLAFQRIVFFDSSEREKREQGKETNLSEFFKEYRLPSYTTKVINIECFAMSFCDGIASGRFDE